MEETKAVPSQEYQEYPAVKQAEGWELIAKNEIDILYSNTICDYFGFFSKLL